MRTLKYPPGTPPVERVRLLRASRLEAGLCMDCGHPRETIDNTRCDACRATHSAKNAHRTQHQRHRLQCACCGEDRTDFLTIDRVAGDSQQDEALGTESPEPVAWLLARTRLADLRLLCWNCQMARHLSGECPHETERRAKVA